MSTSLKVVSGGGCTLGGTQDFQVRGEYGDRATGNAYSGLTQLLFRPVVHIV